MFSDVKNLFSIIPLLKTLRLVSNHLHKISWIQRWARYIKNTENLFVDENDSQFNNTLYSSDDGLKMADSWGSLLSEILNV